MMKKLNYEIKKNGEVWDLHETRTDQVIGSYETPKLAQVSKTHFNRGNGFDGWTPAFMFQKYFDKTRKKWRIPTK
jgi:hypothetical protein